MIKTFKVELRWIGHKDIAGKDRSYWDDMGKHAANTVCIK